jgi:hypothetical protein
MGLLVLAGSCCSSFGDVGEDDVVELDGDEETLPLSRFMLTIFIQGLDDEDEEEEEGETGGGGDEFCCRFDMFLFKNDFEFFSLVSLLWKEETIACCWLSYSFGFRFL